MKAIATYHDLVRRDALDFLPEHCGRVLDFGGGVGATSAMLREQGRASHAVLLDQVAENAVAGVDVGIAIDLEDSGALAQLLERSGPFDTILALDILEHLRDPWAIVAALEPALVPGGLLLVSVPNVCSLDVTGPLLLRGRFDYVDAGVRDRTHLRWFTRDSAIALARGTGLKLEGVRHNPMSRRYRLAQRLTLGVFERFLARQYLVLVRKPVS